MNPYDVLGVEKSASLDEIKKVYRRLARETHPDLNPGDAGAEARFKEVSVAYEILTDEDKRRAFDEFGEISLEAGFDAERARAQRAGFEQRFGQAEPGSFGESFEFADLDDLFQAFGAGGGARGFRGRAAGGGGGGRIRMRGGDLESTLELDFEDAVRGGQKSLSVPRIRADGSTFQEDVTVRIPSGVSDGGRLRIPGKGAEGHGGGPPGDLWLRVRVKPHPVLRLAGRDLELDLPLTLAEATLGAKIEVPTLDGPVTLSVPPGTSSHQKLRLRGQGVPAGSGRAAGDLFARTRIVVPKQVDEKLREALESAEQSDPRPEGFR